MNSYDGIVQEFVGTSVGNRFLGDRTVCRYCGSANMRDFGSSTNAHAFPAALGNRILYSLDECTRCNYKFSQYEDALTKCVGPFLTLGGRKGRKKVRQTGRSNSGSTIRHRRAHNGLPRGIRFTANGTHADLVQVTTDNSQLNLRMPIEGDKFIPRYAYKALLKIAISLLPKEELPKFSHAIACLQTLGSTHHPFPLQVGFSYASVGNAPPTMAGSLLRRVNDNSPIPYMIFIFVAGSVCFQIQVKSDDLDRHVPVRGNLGVRWTSKLAKPEGGYFPIEYSPPVQFDWTSVEPILQPFGAFDLAFDPQTTAGKFTPVMRNTNRPIKRS